jgi:hypothetical protein
MHPLSKITPYPLFEERGETKIKCSPFFKGESPEGEGDLKRLATEARGNFIVNLLSVSFLL